MTESAPAAAPPAAAEGSYSGLLNGLRRTPKQLPCSYLYDAAGSELYERITELEEYYPFRTEQDMLRRHAKDIASYITPGSVVVELGCGSAQKTSILLKELLARDGPEQVRFAGIDCSGAALDMAKAALLGGCPGLAPCNISLVCKEYTQGIAECRRMFPNDRLVVLWLGSSVGNLAPDEAVQFFRDMGAGAGSDIQVLLCADLWKDCDILYAAYHDREGVTEAFIKNGVRHALGSLGSPAAADPANWDYEVDVNAEHTQVEMWLRARAATGQLAPGVSVAAGERILVEVSRKFTPAKLAGLAYNSGLYIQAAWRNELYSIQLLVTPEEALRRSWVDGDTFFCALPNWSKHPIAVRHPFCFYYGHLASFAKLKILPEAPESAMDTMMSRGIDPDVADPSRCHAHPEAPPAWPSRAELKSYVAGVRQAILSSGALRCCGDDQVAMRRVCLAVEHDRMHLETLAYMTAQQVKADFLAGPERPMTPRGSLAEKMLPAPGDKPPLPATVLVPGGEVQLGVPTNGSVGFVWDNEGPPSPPQQVAACRVAVAPVSIGDFYRFAVAAKGYECPDFWSPEDFSLFAGRGQVLPATWSQAHEGAAVFVHWPNGSTCGWRDVADEPVLCSLAEAEAYCRWAGPGARIMSEPEYVRLLAPDVAGRVRQLREGGWEWTATPFEPLPGFEAMPEYPEYSADFFDGKHYVLRGSSPVTHPALRRDSFRNFYQRSYPYVFAKFRLCFDASADA